ncbi:unnamed protein product [Closterium sp. Naga37s-1]|nr:unnamed protein product [Closterium sp. Naga37s-1]
MYCATTRKGVDDTSSVRLERVAFDKGLDELAQKGFTVEGIISDQGTTFRGAASERGLNHQVDWWHVKRTLYKLFLKELQDAVRAPVAVDKATCIEDLWLATIDGLRQWMTARGLEKESKASLKGDLVEAVCKAMGTIVYRKMTPEEAKWKFPELRNVVRMGGECSPVEVPVTYGEVPGASDADVRERDERAERAAVDMPTPEERNVDAQWEDVEELWSYDVHPTQGARPTSLASTLIMLAHAGANGNSHFIGGSTPWANTDTETGYHCKRDKAELPSDQGDDVADAVIKDAEEWSDGSDEWWVAGRYDGQEVDVWVAGQDE